VRGEVVTHDHKTWGGSAFVEALESRELLQGQIADVLIEYYSAVHSYTVKMGN
jgi:hypothetical protein